MCDNAIQTAKFISEVGILQEYELIVAFFGREVPLTISANNAAAWFDGPMINYFSGGGVEGGSYATSDSTSDLVGLQRALSPACK